MLWPGRCLPLVALLLSPVALAQDRLVDLELLLAVDTSASIDAVEFAQQRDGLAMAFRDPAVVAAIEAVEGGIAVAVLQWGHDFQQRMATTWMAVSDRGSAERFARAVETSPRHFVGNGTAISWAMRYGARQFPDNGFRGRRRTIDISADGRNNSGTSPERVRDELVAEGITINALAIKNGDLALDGYFETQVIGGRNAFVIATTGFDDYARAIRLKLLREILVPVAQGPADEAARGPQS